MSTSISQLDLEVLTQILESFVRCSVLMKIGVRSCSDELRRWFWVEIALEFYSGFKYTHENSRMQLTGCQNRKKHVHAQSRHRKCPFWSGFRLRESVWLTPSDSSRNSTQKTFFMIFPKILIWHELPWISVNCHEMRGSQENFVDTIGFFIKFCATYVLDRSVEQIWAPLYGFGGLFFFFL